MTTTVGGIWERYQHLCPTSLEESLTRYLSKIDSSYNRGEFWKVLFILARFRRWQEISELGVLNGYGMISLIAGASYYQSPVFGYDIFEDYEYNSSQYSETLRNIRSAPVSSEFHLIRKNICPFASDPWLPQTSDLLVVDLSNCGQICRNVVAALDFSVPRVVVFEGGARRRDNVWWMREFNRQPIKESLEELSIQFGLSLCIVEPFPGISILTNEPSFIPPGLFDCALE